MENIISIHNSFKRRLRTMQTDSKYTQQDLVSFIAEMPLHCCPVDCPTLPYTVPIALCLSPCHTKLYKYYCYISNLKVI